MEAFGASQENKPEISTLLALKELVQLSSSSRDVESYLKLSLNVLLRHFGFSFARCYLQEAYGNGNEAVAKLAQSIGYLDPSLFNRLEGASLFIDSTPPEQSILVRAIRSGEVLSESFVHQTNHLSRTNAKSEIIQRIALPLNYQEDRLGVLDIYFSEQSPSATTITAQDAESPSLTSSSRYKTLIEGLALMAKQLSMGLLCLESASEDQLESHHSQILYKTAYQIAQANEVSQLLSIASQVLQSSPYRTMLLLAAGDSLHIVHSWPMPSSLDIPTQPRDGNLSRYPRLPLPRRVVYSYFPNPKPVVINDLGACNLPQSIVELPRRLGCQAATFVPVIRDNNLAALLILASPQDALPSTDSQTTDELESTRLVPYSNLAELITNMLAKLQAQIEMQRRLTEMETLWTISQTMSLETDLSVLYETIHRQVEHVMGELSSFAIALYDKNSDQIRIPYMVEEKKQLTIPPFPLGEGLSSIVIRSGKPLLLVEDAEKKAISLGAKIIGAPAKSWLGVPLLHGGETFGLIIVQDVQHEHRFSEDDQRLLGMLASQIAVVVRNTHLLETSRRQAEQERLLNEIAEKLRKSSDMHAIIRTTTEEIAQTVGAVRASLKVAIPRTAASIDKEQA